MARIDVLLKAAKDMGASDLHVLSGYPPVLRYHGDIQPVDFQVLSAEQCRQLVYEMMTDDQVAIFEKEGDIDFSYEIGGELRVRANVFEQYHGVSACLRLLPSQIFPLEQLGLPSAISRFADLTKGLVVVTGATDHFGHRHRSARAGRQGHHAQAHREPRADDTPDEPADHLPDCGPKHEVCQCTRG